MQIKRLKIYTKIRHEMSSVFELLFKNAKRQPSCMNQYEQQSSEKLLENENKTRELRMALLKMKPENFYHDTFHLKECRLIVLDNSQQGHGKNFPCAIFSAISYSTKGS